MPVLEPHYIHHVLHSYRSFEATRPGIGLIPDRHNDLEETMSIRVCLLVCLFASALFAAPPFPTTIPLVGTLPDTVDLTAWNLEGSWKVNASPEGVTARLDGQWLVIEAGGPPKPRLGLLELSSASGKRLVIPVERRPIHAVEFMYQAMDQLSNEVSVAGSFNGWNADAHPMEDDGTGRYRCTVQLPPGTYPYKIVVDGEWLPDPSNPEQVANGFGGFNSVLHLSANRSEARFLKHAYRDGNLVFAYYSASSPPPDTIIVLGDGEVISSSYNHPLLTISPEDHALIRILGTDAAGDPLPPCWTRLEEGRPLGLGETDNGIHDSFVYCLFPDRFRSGDPGNDGPLCDPRVHEMVNYRGGDLAGVHRTLAEGYFDSLGVNTLWLGPLYPAPGGASVSPIDYTPEMRALSVAKLESLLSSQEDPYFGLREHPIEPGTLPSALAYTGYHGYWPAGDRAVEHRFGDTKTMLAFMSSAHDRGFRVILDLVPHHVHRDHPWATAHPDWFQPLQLPDGSLNLRHWDEHRLSTWFDPFLPTLDLSTQSPAVDSVVASAAWWLTTFSLDGFRHDATKHIPHSFWRALTKGLRNAAPDREILQLGETFGSRELVGSYVTPAEMDGQFDFNLYYACRPLFCGVSGSSFHNVIRELEQSLDVFGPLHLMANITGSHDQGRFVTLAQGDIPPGENEREWGWTHLAKVTNPDVYARLQLFYLFNLSIPGIPVLYYGDEIGMPGGADPDNRRFMRFGEDLTEPEREHLTAMRALGTVRKNTPVFPFGDLVVLYREEKALAMARAFFDQLAIVILNLKDEPFARELDLAGLPSTDELVSRFGDGEFSLDDAKLTYHVPPLSGLVLVSR
jgi:glycosidase